LTEEALQASNEEKWKTWLAQYKDRLKKEADEHPDVKKLNNERRKVSNKFINNLGSVLSKCP